MSFIFLILDWFSQIKRPLPWRNTPNVYQVWLSEIILQQTRVEQGLPYFNRFIEAFPTIETLANADEQKVLTLWQGLGYYTRARNLHKTAQIVVKDFNGVFPNNYHDLQKLPGIGKYTAAAIASIAFGQNVPAIDGNAYRVYARFFGISSDIAASNAHTIFFEKVQPYVPNDRAGDFNQAIMELGSLICKPQNPICNDCPISVECVAFITGKVAEFPVKSKKVKVKPRWINYYILMNDLGEVLINKRTKQDIWKNLYDFPTMDSDLKEPEHPIFIAEIPEVYQEFTHVLTHKKIHLKFYKLTISNQKFEALKNENHYIAIDKLNKSNYPTPKPITQILDNLWENES